MAKKTVVFAATPERLDQIQRVVRSGRYRSGSEFLREAIDEKLNRERAAILAEQVARYCAGGYASEDDDLIAGQAFDPELR